MRKKYNNIVAQPIVKKYVLDTSAVLAYYQDEPGSDRVDAILQQMEKGEAAVLISFMTIFEISYLVSSRDGLEAARNMALKVRNLGFDEAWPDEEVLWKAAEIKASGGLSVADAFIAALSAVRSATLVHKDSEFDRIKEDIDRLGLS